MQVWSGDKFKATYHRVIFPTSSNPVPAGTPLPGRKSVVFFAIPDNDTVSCDRSSTDHDLSDSRG